MKTAVLFAFLALLIAVANSAPAPEQPIPGPGAPFIRVARADPDPEAKKDLEEAESAFIAAYPYYYPHYLGGHYVLVGK